MFQISKGPDFYGTQGSPVPQGGPSRLLLPCETLSHLISWVPVLFLCGACHKL